MSESKQIETLGRKCHQCRESFLPAHRLQTLCAGGFCRKTMADAFKFAREKLLRPKIKSSVDGG